MRSDLAPAVAVCLLLALSAPLPTLAQDGKSGAAALVSDGEKALKAGRLTAAEVSFRKAVDLEPACAPAYAGLASVARRRGDKDARIEWARKASMADRRNANYTLAWAEALAARYPAASFVFDIPEYRLEPPEAKLAQALSRLADEAIAPAEEQAYLEQYGDRFGQAPSPAMMRLCALYAASDPAKAVRFAETVAQSAGAGNYASADWADFLPLMRNLVRANQLLARKAFGEASAVLDATRPLSAPWSIATRFNAELTLAKAEASAGSGDVEGAYRLAAHAFVSAPTERVRRAAERWAAALHRSTADLVADLRAQLRRDAELATDFAIPTYADGRTVSLSALRGKVVLLGFWFPT